MCGICGIIDFSNTISEKGKLSKSMSDQLVHRGPDDEGFYEDNYISLGFKRLSVIDLNKGNQPIYSSDKSVISIFNGEIYNFKEIKKELENKKYKFYSNSDSEVIVSAYLHWGLDFVQKLNGIFSICIYDKNKKQAFLIRDRLGVKPLYYFEYKNSLVFASEIKPLVNLPFFEKKLNFKALSSYLSFRYPTEDEETFFEKIKRVSPGNIILKGEFEKQEKKYWDLPIPNSNEDLGEDFYTEKLEHLLNSSVKKQLVSDVPLGVFLSGGLDSSLLSAIASKNLNTKLNTYSVTLTASGYNESEKANLVSKYLNTNHHELILKKDDFINNLTNIIKVKGVPVSIPHEYALYLLSREMKKKITVVLSGEGADEFFGGYSRVQKSPFDFGKQRLIKKFFQKNNVDDFFKFFLNRYNWFSPNQKNKILSTDFKNQTNYDKDLFYSWKKLFLNNTSQSYYDKVLYAFQKKHLQCLLDRLDVMTMAAGVEARVPFLDHELISFINNVPFKYKIKWKSILHKTASLFESSNTFSEKNDINKYLLRKVAKKYLPTSISGAKKLGFPLPMNEWLKLDSVKDVLLDKKTLRRNLYDKNNLNDLLNNDKKDTFDFSGKRIWMLLNVEMWMREFIDK